MVGPRWSKASSVAGPTGSQTKLRDGQVEDVRPPMAFWKDTAWGMVERSKLNQELCETHTHT